jgi:peptidoglycan/LPS O-acetylase OafA/YrhL
LKIFPENQYVNPYNYFLFLQNYYLHIPTVAHTWSIAIEEHFYLSYPLLLVSISKFTPSAQQQRKYLLLILFFLIIFINIFRYLYLFQPDGSKWYLSQPVYFQQTQFRLDALMFGCLLRASEIYIERIIKQYYIQWLLIILGIVIFLYFIFNGFDQFNYINYPLAYIASGSLILATYKNENLFAQLLLKISLLGHIGRYSYGIYLWHYSLIFVFILWHQPGSITSILIYCICAISLGIISTITLEKYFLKIRSHVAP